MGMRGPKSSLDRLKVVQFDTARLPPPDGLNAAESLIWEQALRSKPQEYFHADDLILLREYCRAVAMCDRLAEKCEAANGGDTLARYLGLRDKEVRRVTVLATKLRMTPQSRYDKQVAATASRNNATLPKPWEKNPFDDVDV